MGVGVSPRLRSLELEPRASELSRGKAVECCRIVDQNLLLDRRIECPLRQLVDPRTIVARIQWRKILTCLAAARMGPVRAPDHTIRIGIDERLGDQRRMRVMTAATIWVPNCRQAGHVCFWSEADTARPRLAYRPVANDPKRS